MDSGRKTKAQPDPFNEGSMGISHTFPHLIRMSLSVGAFKIKI